MYQIYKDDKDKVVELTQVPQSSVGAPCPMVLSDEHTLVLAYYMEAPRDGWDGKTVRMVGPDTEGESVAMVRFHSCYARMFGPPNDEAFSGHPLYSRGLRPYSANIIENSSWIHSLAKMNNFRCMWMYDSRKHFIWAFHGSTFECVADGYEIILKQGSLRSLVPEMLRLLV